jgi:phosphopantetheinyl transferase
MINTAKCLKAGFEAYGISEADVEYIFGEDGKPYAKGLSNISFSVAHSDNISLCAFYENEIGIDCEKATRRISSGVIRRWFSKGEQAAFEGNELLLWVAKEAASKYTGKGFAKGRKETEIPYFEDELSLDGLWLKRLEIGGALTVICAQEKDGISITEVM